jgi:hypothetical protein
MVKFLSTFAFLILMACSTSQPPAGREPASTKALERAVEFFSWLEKNSFEFGNCVPSKKNGSYELCDKTLVSAAEIKELFKKTPKDLVYWLRGKGFKVEILCDSSLQENTFKDLCQITSERKIFKELNSLHGQYLPAEKAILIRSTASTGSLIHEYIHSLQARNEHKVFGRKYKKERIEIQNQIVQFMDSEIALIGDLEKQGKTSEAKSRLKPFALASEAMQGFAPWQDLIDERSIFLLYIIYGNEFGAGADDIALAKRNMGYICNNPKLRPILKGQQCALF